MSDFRLCVKRKNITPYYSKVIKREIFTIEELSYFIYENIHLIDESFIENSLIEFVYNTIGEDISRLNFTDAIGVILNSNNFYGKDDIEIVINILKNYKEGDVLTRAKMIGDKCLINKEYNLAIRHYTSILNRNSIRDIDKDFMKDVMYNKGIALARMLNFRDANKIFKRLYEMDGSDEIKFNYYLTLKFYDSKLYDKYRKYNSDEVFKYIEDATKEMGKDNIVYNVGARYMLIIDDVIDEWKHQVCEDYCD